MDKADTHMNRRKFLQTSSLPLYPVVFRGIHEPGEDEVAGKYDLVIRHGLVIDPSRDIRDYLDIAISRGKIAKVEKNISARSAGAVLNAESRIVTPGFIDIHVHVYPEVTGLGIPADPNHIKKGVPTVVDAGSAGYYTWPGFRKWVIEVSDTRIYALLNIAYHGMIAGAVGELEDLRYADPKLALQRIEENRDTIIGVKIRLTENITGTHDLKALALAREAADAARLPMMVHINDSYSPIGDILALMRSGDIMTHCYHGNRHGIIDSKGKVLPEVRAAFNRGVHFDVGHGAGSFAFRVAQKAIEQEFYPGTISSDLHRANYRGPVFDQVTTVSKFLNLGLPLEHALDLTTSRPARLFKFNEVLGTLTPGAEADVTILELREGNFEFTDSTGETRTGTQKLVPWKVVKSGVVHDCLNS